MSWGNLDDQSTFHPKVLKAGNGAWGAMCRMIAWSKAHGTNGEIPGSVARMIATGEELDSAFEAGLLETRPDGYAIHDFLDWNDSAQRVRAIREKRKKAGKVGGLSRQASAKANAQASAKQVLKQNSSKGVGLDLSSGSDPEGEPEGGIDRTGVLPAHARYADAYALGIQDAGFTFSGISAPWEYGALGRACAHAEGRRGEELDAWFRLAAKTYRQRTADKSGQNGYQPTAFLRWLDDTQWRAPRAKAPQPVQERRSPPEPTPEPFRPSDAQVTDLLRAIGGKGAA